VYDAIVAKPSGAQLLPKLLFDNGVVIVGRLCVFRESRFHLFRHVSAIGNCGLGSERATSGK
jgi:hypothetical protein